MSLCTKAHFKRKALVVKFANSKVCTCSGRFTLYNFRPSVSDRNRTLGFHNESRDFPYHVKILNKNISAVHK